PGKPAHGVVEEVERTTDASGHSERVTIPGGVGYELSALLDHPSGESRGVVILAGAFGSTKELRGLRRVAQRFASLGWTALRFDFTGLGASGGDFAATSLSTNVEDLEAVASWLREGGTPARMALGLSLGGAAVLIAAPSLPELAVVATLGTPSDTGHLRGKLLQRAPELPETGRAELDLLGNRVTVGQALLEDLALWNLRDAAAHLERPYVVFHSVRDRIVEITHAGRLFRAARHPKSFVSLGGADHLLLEDESDAFLVADTLAAFGERYASSSPA
ncbi:alpha/beta hydrolase, partial [bacterium]|nr:alpha/beta hydrolase [bacterium]